MRMHRARLKAAAFAVMLAASFFLGSLCIASADGNAPGVLAPNPNNHIRALHDSKYYQIVVDKASQLFTVLRQDSKGNYTVIDRQFVCSTGVPPRTSPGTFKISTKTRWLSSPAFHEYEQFACRFNGHIWIHSVCYLKRNSNALVTESYRGLGKPVSAGCIRLAVRDAKWIFVNCPPGTVVKVVNSGGPSAVCVEPQPPLPANADYDPTDAAAIR